ncbi:hypothetical protein PIIN_04492 [Serendipita indica DSM 11827]|uniref:Uncharacterized protein n=1 Tax=Serendipita indica (strain DSM 11827) TaxID=1109443 RepID=G4TGW7_SERID|nr:hypothetical protein PIIN_04492 [Serendipita indica DSM 11827]
MRKLTRVRTDVLPSTTITAGLPQVNPFSRPKSFIKGMVHAVLATAIFRCWHFILFYSLEAFVVTYFYMVHGKTFLAIENTLMNVLGTVLGFVIGYRSSASFERYNEGRRFWSQVVLNVRMFARTVWFHVPDGPTNGMQMGPAKDVSEYKARTLVEKKTVLNLLEAFAVALKHYLRGETSNVYYEDLYPLIKFLPAYALPAGYEIQWPDPRNPKARTSSQIPRASAQVNRSSFQVHQDGLPLPATTKQRGPTLNVQPPSLDEKRGMSESTAHENIIYLAPSRDPPPYHIFDFWPMSLFVRSLQKGGKELKGRKALRDRAKNPSNSDNVALEISLYLSSYVASLQQRGLDGLTAGTLMGALGQLVDALTGLERVLSTPVPWAYNVHIWFVALIWLLLLILKPLGWLTIPGVALASFVYCGLMKCAEEIEDPFGYDYNDLNLDHFTHNIIRKELASLTALPMPDPTKWAFSPENDAVFDVDGNAIYLDPDSLAPPSVWVKRGETEIRAALSAGNDAPVTPIPIPAKTLSPPLERMASPATIRSSIDGSSTQGAIGAGVLQPGGSLSAHKSSFGSPDGAGLVAGAAVAAAGINAEVVPFDFTNSPSPPPTGV